MPPKQDWARQATRRGNTHVFNQLHGPTPCPAPALPTIKVQCLMTKLRGYNTRAICITFQRHPHSHFVDVPSRHVASKILGLGTLAHLPEHI